MRAENISEEMERIMIEAWMSIRKPDYEPSAIKVRASVVRQLAKEGYTDAELPKLRTFQEYLRRARKTQITLREKSKVDESKPWNLETLDDNDWSLPHNTIPFVLQLWRYCKNLGADLTIRQAKWASRLSYLLKDLDISEQWIHIMRYSREEELSLLSGTQMRTDQLNGLLIMESWERMTLAETDVKFKANRRINHTFKPIGRDGGIVEEDFYALADIAQSHLVMILENKVIDNIDRANELSMLIHSLPSSSKYFPNFESRMVYLRHLAKLSRLPYWRTAEPKEIHSLIIELRTWIVSQAEEKIKRENNPQPESPLGLISWHGSFPLDIYLRAGFSLEEDTKELEVELRKAHPDLFEQEGDK